MNADAQDWWHQSQADLKTAKDNRLSNPYAAVMFAQQAVEKALKAEVILSWARKMLQ